MENSPRRIEPDFLRWHADRRLSARPVWTFCLCESLQPKSRLFYRKKDLRELYRCLLGCFASFLSGQMFYGKSNQDIQSSAITSTSRSTSKMPKLSLRI